MGDQDHSYKQIFSHPQMVADLLRGFVREPWLEQVDLTTLEKASGSYITDDLRDREDDIIWRVRWGKEWLYVYLLLEFQSSIDRFMAVRIMVYVGLLYQDLIKSKQLTRRGLLPPVLPIVLYNGDARWTAAEEVADLIEVVPGGLERYRPALRYLTLDEGRYREEELASLHNLVAAVFRLENSRSPEDIIKVLETLIEWLQTPEQESLRRAITHWLSRVVLRRRAPTVVFSELTDLREVKTMLSERVEEWERQWSEQGREKGFEQGRQKGREEGREEEAVALILRQVESLFGSANDRTKENIEALSLEQLEELAVALVKMPNVEALSNWLEEQSQG